MLAESDGETGRLIQTNIFADEIKAQSSANADCSHYLLADALGSIRSLTASFASGQSLSESYDYTAFGTRLSGSGSLTSYAFTGQLLDSATGLQYHRARWLNPAIGQWLSPDPIFDFPENFASAYSYVGRDPVNRRDALGLFSFGELNVSSAIQGIVSQVILPEVTSAITKAILAAAAVDLSFIFEPIVDSLAEALGLPALMERLTSVLESDVALIDKLLEIVRVVTIIGFCVQTAQTAFSILQLFIQGGLSAAIQALQGIWGFIVSLEGLRQEFSVEYNPKRSGTIVVKAPSGCQKHHIMTQYGRRANMIMDLLEEHGLEAFDLKKDARNLMLLKGHRGRHTIKYHEWVYNRVEKYLRKAEPDHEDSALSSALVSLANGLRKNPSKIRMK